MSKITLSSKLASSIRDTINLSSGIEHGFFATVSGKGNAYKIETLILPEPGDWLVQAPSQLKPSTSYAMRAVDAASEEKNGLLFVHTHPDPLHPPQLSSIDEYSLKKLGGLVVDILEEDFLVGIISQQGWYVAKMQSNTFVEVNTVAEINDGYKLLSATKQTNSEELDDRQTRSLGPVNKIIRTLTVAVIGSGGLGSSVSEQLVRMGVNKLILVDNDVIDTPSNLRRIYGTRIDDFSSALPKLKVEVVGTYLRSLGLGTQVEILPGDITNKEILTKVLEADIVFCATDTHSSRAALNNLPYKYNTPVIDMGIRVASNTAGIAGFFSAIRILTPTSACFLCREVVDSERVRLENLSLSEVEAQKKEGYIPGEYGEPQPSIISLTTLAASMGISAFINLLLDVEGRYEDIIIDMLEGYVNSGKAKPKIPGCIFCNIS